MTSDDYFGNKYVFMSFVNCWVETADLMNRGMLFHSLAAVTVNILSPASVPVCGYVRRISTFCGSYQNYKIIIGARHQVGLYKGKTWLCGSESAKVKQTTMTLRYAAPHIPETLTARQIHVLQQKYTTQQKIQKIWALGMSSKVKCYIFSSKQCLCVTTF